MSEEVGLEEAEPDLADRRVCGDGVPVLAARLIVTLLNGVSEVNPKNSPILVSPKNTGLLVTV